jgi:hypothetical protein
MNIDKKYLLSWQSQMLGPHSVEEIKSLLNERKIHSLFKVQSDEGEVLVREFLAGLNDDRKRASAAQAEASVTQPEAAVIEAIAYDERRQAASEKTLPPLPTSLLADESVSPPPLHTGGEAKFGFAMASFWFRGSCR